MDVRRTRFAPGIATALLAMAPLASAWSATLPLSYETTSPDGTSVQTTPAIGSGTTTIVPGAPTSYHYGQTFTAPTLTVPGSTSTTYPSGFGFYDDYVFTIGGSTASSVTTTIDLGTLQISDLQERLFRIDSPGAYAVYLAGGLPYGVIEAWTSPLPGGSGEVAVLPATALAPGTYVLQIRGNVTGTDGGSYAGVLNVTPVPLPAGLPLLLGGLGLIGAARRRSRA